MTPVRESMFGSIHIWREQDTSPPSTHSLSLCVGASVECVKCKYKWKWHDPSVKERLSLLQKWEMLFCKTVRKDWDECSLEADSRSITGVEFLLCCGETGYQEETFASNSRTKWKYTHTNSLCWNGEFLFHSGSFSPAFTCDKAGSAKHNKGQHTWLQLHAAMWL